MKNSNLSQTNHRFMPGLMAFKEEEFLELLSNFD
jgi:hypothetical protein